MQFIPVHQKRNTVDPPLTIALVTDYLTLLFLDYSQPLSNSNDFSNEFHVSNNIIFKHI
jgi:hypothetical protein